MRLLKCSDDGQFRLTGILLGENIPPYAILSHTWGPEEEEISYSDMQMDIEDTRWTAKAGYDKLKFCAKQARHDHLDYFWVDTCCIDKSSSAELAEAITSMFQWYRDSSRCYVYLPDTSSITGHGDDSKRSHQARELSFRACKWFSRGWTLQELLAPASVEFFTREGRRLGDKRSLEQQIHEITGIAIPALQGASLSNFTIDERFKWTRTRRTTRDEDAAYCLLGVFGITMSPRYGEGKERALLRLVRAIEDDEARRRNGIVSALREWSPFIVGSTVAGAVGGALRDAFVTALIAVEAVTSRLVADTAVAPSAPRQPGFGDEGGAADVPLTSDLPDSGDPADYTGSGDPSDSTGSEARPDSTGSEARPDSMGSADPDSATTGDDTGEGQTPPCQLQPIPMRNRPSPSFRPARLSWAEPELGSARPPIFGIEDLESSSLMATSSATLDAPVPLPASIPHVPHPEEVGHSAPSIPLTSSQPTDAPEPKPGSTPCPPSGETKRSSNSSPLAPSRTINALTQKRGVSPQRHPDGTSWRRDEGYVSFNPIQQDFRRSETATNRISISGYRLNKKILLPHLQKAFSYLNLNEDNTFIEHDCIVLQLSRQLAMTELTTIKNFVEDLAPRLQPFVKLPGSDIDF